ncbi:tRNA 2-selenouridine(34) synthase MnmH [Paraburkholderia caffeinilytica]|uniref:tRNA 2-selenouridine synthase n=1 Tax=Paraburkholderia caffeinilytica TaxID=1761016 RepID=A0ABQ1LPM4_9BURK|nr:tRNA 2-selenouridine(34) synthase MnmH [Paraburkholderia caffeinilytica]GGC27588.1 tRNA 2-selenouridine synthase [Paraburkholderia caffeinilytica]CAB3780386.1 tRNA 2-selenouridine synthase [Paraburkholderia caffeinilytica]
MYDLDTLGKFDLVIDARSPREFAEDHLPGAINLPVVFDDEYAEVGTMHRIDPMRAYQIGVAYSLKNIARHLELPFFRTSRRMSILVYCFRGGKRSKLWTDTLETIGYKVERLPAGWKGYRNWVRQTLDEVPKHLQFNVLSGPTGCGKTRLLLALREAGAQVIDLEALASHRGSIIGAIPGRAQPSQKLFDSLLLAEIGRLDLAKPVWIENESKRIGHVQLPATLFHRMHGGRLFAVETPMSERIAMWRHEYPHFERDPVALVAQLSYLKALLSGMTLEKWVSMAERQDIDALFESIMRDYYDPAYLRSTKKNYVHTEYSIKIQLETLDSTYLANIARHLIAETEVLTSNPPE